MKPFKLTLDLDYQDALKRSIQLLEEVGIDNAEKRIEDYPHQFSGGCVKGLLLL